MQTVSLCEIKEQNFIRDPNTILIPEHYSCGDEIDERYKKTKKKEKKEKEMHVRFLCVFDNDNF